MGTPITKNGGLEPPLKAAKRGRIREIRTIHSRLYITGRHSGWMDSVHAPKVPKNQVLHGNSSTFEKSYLIVKKPSDFDEFSYFVIIL